MFERDNEADRIFCRGVVILEYGWLHHSEHRRWAVRKVSALTHHFISTLSPSTTQRRKHRPRLNPHIWPGCRLRRNNFPTLLRQRLIQPPYLRQRIPQCVFNQLWGRWECGYCYGQVSGGCLSRRERSSLSGDNDDNDETKFEMTAMVFNNARSSWTAIWCPLRLE